MLCAVNKCGYNINGFCHYAGVAIAANGGCNLLYHINGQLRQQPQDVKANPDLINEYDVINISE